MFHGCGGGVWSFLQNLFCSGGGYVLLFLGGGSWSPSSLEGVMFSKLCSPNQLMGDIAPSVSASCSCCLAVVDGTPPHRQAWPRGFYADALLFLITWTQPVVSSHAHGSNMRMLGKVARAKQRDSRKCQMWRKTCCERLVEGAHDARSVENKQSQHN